MHTKLLVMTVRQVELPSSRQLVSENYIRICTKEIFSISNKNELVSNEA